MAENPLNKSTQENKSAARSNASPSNIEVGSIEVGRDVDGDIVVGHGNIINRITNFFQGDTQAQIERRNRRIMLGHVEKFWVKGILEKSLHGAALLDLGIKEDPHALSYPWAIKREANKETVPAGTSMLTIFQEIGMGRSLLILGAPGSGKTTMLLELTRQLIEQARQDVTEPIPVVFNLASWTEKLTLADWLASELNDIYTIPKKIAPSWITDNRIMLLLDGLDEVKQESRHKCVDAINRFRKENGLTSMVVCSRIQEYAELKTLLALDGAIEIQPLTLDQVDAYFRRFGDGLAGIRQVFEKDIVVREMTETPLFLSIMTLAYHDTPSKEILVSPDVGVQRKYLFDTYIERMFERPRSKNALIKKGDVLHWLSWLAQKMVDYHAVPYLFENMQPKWLRPTEAWWFDRIQEAGIALILGLIGTLVGVLNPGLISPLTGAVIGAMIFPSLMLVVSWGTKVFSWLVRRWMGWPVTGAVAGVLIGTFYMMIILLIYPLTGMQIGLTDILLVPFFAIFMGLVGMLVGWLYTLRGGGRPELESNQTFWDKEIKMVESFRWNRNKVGKDPFLIAWVFTMIFSLIGGIYFGLAMGLSIGLFSGLITGLEHRPIDQTTYPGQKITFSIRNFFFSFVSITLITGFILVSISGLIGISGSGLDGIFISVVIAGLLFGLPRGGSAVFMHYTLRLICLINNLLPWRLVPFLDYCVDLIFLRRVGGGYIFVHRLLMEHFAEMDM